MIAEPFVILALTLTQPTDGLLTVRLAYCCEWASKHNACVQRVGPAMVPRWHESQRASVDGAWFAVLELMARARMDCGRWS